MNPPKTSLDHVNAVGERDAIMVRYLKMGAWTPTMAALLIYGVQAPDGCNELPDGGVDFNGKRLHVSAAPFHDARRVLRYWDDWNNQDERDERGDPEGPQHEMHPGDFFNWCVDQDIETPWIDLFHYLNGRRSKEYLNTLPSPLSMLVPIATSTAVSAGSTGRTNAEDGRLIHRLKIRFGPLDGIIQKARELASDPNDYHAVWLELVKIAQSAKPPSPIEEFIDGDIKWRSGDVLKLLNKNALRRRLIRLTTSGT